MMSLVNSPVNPPVNPLANAIDCPSCQSVLRSGDRFCTACGHALFAIDGPRAEPIDAREQGNPLKHHIEEIRSRHLAGISDRGLWHQKNEDAIAVEGLTGGRSILVVCDGVSSSAHPENASKVAAITAAAALHRSAMATPTDALAGAIAEAQTAVSGLAAQSPTNPPATTIIAALVQERAEQTIATIGWLGDSRAYWVSKNHATLLTQDDSWLNAVCSSGKLSPEEALRSPYAHAITRWLGANASNDPSIIQLPLQQEGYLILCTDGLWNYAPDPDRLSEICQPTQPQPAISIAQELVNHALSCGGRDNISVAIFYHRPRSRYTKAA
jgi:PPM family protein phosphatase